MLARLAHLTLTIGTLWLALPVIAQTAHLDPLIEMLDSEDLHERESASLRIPRIPGLTLQNIERHLRSEGLSSEQRLRLGRIAESFFASTPRGGLGVRFSLDSGTSVSLAGVVEGFPAADLLQPGDLLLEVDGHPHVTQDWLKSWIISHAPGESLHLLVQRAGEQIEVDVPVGSFDDLGNTAALDRRSISQAYKLRQSRLETDAPPESPVGGSLSAMDWIDASYPGGAYTDEPRPIAILTGHWVSGFSESMNRAMGWGSRSLHLLHPLSLTGEGYPEVVPRDLRVDLRARLQRQQETFERRISQLNELLNKREFTPNEVENIEQQIGAARVLVEQTRVQLAELDALPEPETRGH